MIAGTPDSVIPRLNKVLDVLRPGIFSFWLDGPVPHKDRLRCLELLNRDVIPAMREHGKKLGLIDPFSCPPGGKRLNGRAGIGRRSQCIGGVDRGSLVIHGRFISRVGTCRRSRWPKISDHYPSLYEPRSACAPLARHQHSRPLVNRRFLSWHKLHGDLIVASRVERMHTCTDLVGSASQSQSLQHLAGNEPFFFRT